MRAIDLGSVGCVTVGPYGNEQMKWMCHECSTYNAADRSKCRACNHLCCVEVMSKS